MSVKRDVVGAILLIALLAFAIVIVQRRVTITWRLVPVQQSVILPPALGAVTLTPGDKLVQRFSVPPDIGRMLTTPASLALNFTTAQGKAAPDVQMTLRDAGGAVLGNWLIPSAAVAQHAVTIPIVDPRPSTNYVLELTVPATSSTGTPEGSVSLAYSPDVRPQGSSLSISSRPYPGTLGLTISHDVWLGTYLAHYPTLLLNGRSAGSAVWLVVFHLLWILAMVTVVVLGVGLIFARSTVSTGSSPGGLREQGRTSERKRTQLSGRSTAAAHQPKAIRDPVTRKSRL